MPSEVRQFRMHPKLLFDVIQRQAGSLAKAILEGVMNSIDAGATRCEIVLDDRRLSIRDDGSGFRDRGEITSFFEVFGHPHDESERKVYGTFRMGRGQLFAFGHNKWSTGTWRMDVDIKTRGLDYELSEAKHYLGCGIKVELYTPLLPSDLAETARMVGAWTKWAPIPVILNGKVLSRDPSDGKWDVVLPEAYVRLSDQGPLSVYNLGIHVFDASNFRYGTGGEVVSRQQLKVNFARNDVQSDCPVWKKVSKVIDARATDRNTKARTLDDAGRQRLADQLVRGELDYGRAKELRLFTAVNGRHYSWLQLVRHGRFTSCPHGHRLGDRIHQGNVAFVVSGTTLERFGFETLEDMIAWMRGVLEREAPYAFADWAPTCIPFEQLTAGMDDSYEILEEGDYRPNEQVWMGLAASAVLRLGLADRDAGRGRGRSWMYQDRQERRRLLIGLSDQADGWTDGETYVAVNRKFLERIDFDVDGFVKLGALVLHELCHDGPDTAEHGHTQEFYERYHNAHDALAEFADYCFKNLPLEMGRRSRQLTRKQLAVQDKVVRTARARELMEAASACHATGKDARGQT